MLRSEFTVTATLWLAHGVVVDLAPLITESSEQLKADRVYDVIPEGSHNISTKSNPAYGTATSITGLNQPIFMYN